MSTTPGTESFSLDAVSTNGIDANLGNSILCCRDSFVVEDGSFPLPLSPLTHLFATGSELSYHSNTLVGSKDRRMGWANTHQNTARKGPSFTAAHTTKKGRRRESSTCCVTSSGVRLSSSPEYRSETTRIWYVLRLTTSSSCVVTMMKRNE